MLKSQTLAEAIRTDTGEYEVPAKWVAAHVDGGKGDSFRFIDIREPHELEGPLGAIDGVENVPLLKLLSQGARLDADEPLVLICRSGRRSGRAADALRRAGVKTVASVEGGMIAWDTEVEGKTDVLKDEKVANTENLNEAIYRTNGLPEVAAQWVASNAGRFRLIDVREPAELRQTGAIPWAENIPLATFMDGADKLDRDAPIVVSCMSGGRSGRVVRALESAGFTAVASMEGGIMGWKAYGLPTA